MLIKACLNGSREPGEHPALPLTPVELARDAQVVVAAGARALHIHPRRADGQQSLAAQDQAIALSTIRAQCPGIPIGVSTIFWIDSDVTLRLQHIQQWIILPDFASVNFDEPGVAELCNTLLARGIGVEAGISSVEDAELLLNLASADRFLRILIEPGEEGAEAALSNAEAIIRRLGEDHIQLPILLHGYGNAAWPVLEAALQRGYDTRIGLEDTLTLPDGRQAKDNAELVAFARSKAESVGLI
jgi:uncharacterized protein (DUF849 family)